MGFNSGFKGLTLSVLTISMIYVLTLIEDVPRKSTAHCRTHFYNQLLTAGHISIIRYLYVCIKFYHTVFFSQI